MPSCLVELNLLVVHPEFLNFAFFESLYNKGTFEAW